MNCLLEPKDFLADAPKVARQLIGATLLVNGIGGLIIETEAYDMYEPGSHCFNGPTPRNQAMFGPPGHAYIYLNYGIHWCLNFVCRETGHGAGVLIRALQPTHGIETMRSRRQVRNDHRLCAGPGCVGQALKINQSQYGLPLNQPPFAVYAAAADCNMKIVTGPRIGVKKAADLPWRFGHANSPWLSKKF